MNEVDENIAIKIDVNKAFKDKNPGLYRILPKFIFYFLKRLIHQKELNRIFESSKDLYNIEFIDNFLRLMNIKYEVEGIEKVPKNGRYIFVSNHPIGAIEGIILISVIGKNFNNGIKSVANDLLMNIHNLQDVFIPVNKHGQQTREYIKTLNEFYSSDTQITIFPAGLVSRKIDGIVQDLEWQKSFISKAIKYKRDIVPIYIDGINSNFFYNFSRIRKMLGIKTNLDMFLLPHESFMQKGKTIKLIFGEKFSYEHFDKSCSHKEWAAKMRKQVYSLKTNIDN